MKTLAMHKFFSMFEIGHSGFRVFFEQWIRVRHRWLILMFLLFDFRYLDTPNIPVLGWSSLLIYTCFLLFYETKRRFGDNQYLRKFRIYVDIVLFSTIIISAGNLHTPLYILFVIPLIAAGRYFGPKSVLFPFLIINLALTILFFTKLSPDIYLPVALVQYLWFIGFRLTILTLITLVAIREWEETQLFNNIFNIYKGKNRYYFDDSVYKAVLTEVKQALHKNNINVFIHLVDPHTNQLTIQTTNNPEFDWQDQNGISISSNPVVAHVYRTGKAYICNNTPCNAAHPPILPDTRSVISAPIILSYTAEKTKSGTSYRPKHITGVLSVESPYAREFTNDELRTLKFLADHTSNLLFRSILIETNRKITSSLNLKEILNHIFIQTRRLIKFKYGLIFLYDEDKKALIFEQQLGYNHAVVDDIKLWHFSADESITGYLINKAEKLRYGQISQRQIQSKYPQIPFAKSLNSYLGVRLSYKGQIVGAFVLVSDEKNFFSDRDEELLTAIGIQAAIGIHHARTFEAQEKRKQLRTFESKTNAILGKELDVKQTIEKILHIGLELTGADGGQILIVDKKEKKLIAERHINFDFKETAHTELLAKECHVINGIVPFFHHGNIQSEYGNKFLYNRYVKERFQSLGAVRLDFPEDYIGTISFYSLKKNAFTRDQIDFLHKLADQAVHAIKNAIHYSQLKRLYAIQDKLNESLDLNQIIREINKAFESLACSIFIRNGQKLYCKASTGIQGVEKKDLQQVVYDINDHNLTSYVGRTGKAVRIYNETDENELAAIDPVLLQRKAPKFKETEVMQRLLMVPLLSKTGISGVIRLVNSKNFSFTFDDERTLQIIANKLADRIENDMLLIKLDHSAEYFQLERLASVGLLASGVAHQMNTPLGTINNCANTLLKNASDNRNGHYKALKMISEEACRASDILQKLMVFPGSTVTDRTFIDINHEVLRIIELSKHELEIRRIKVKKKLLPKLPRVFMKTNDLVDVLSNIIINAYQEMPYGGILRINTKLIGKVIHIELSDTGNGIPQDRIHRIFYPFYTTKEEAGGTGLGLYWCLRTIKKYQGDITVNSSRGKGSTFVVKIPIGEENYEQT